MPKDRYLIPAIFSLLLPGLGQFFKGEKRKGIMMMIGILLTSLAAAVHFTGYIATFILYAWSIYDAYVNPVPDYNEEKKKELRRILVQVLAVSGILLVITVLLMIFLIPGRSLF